MDGVLADFDAVYDGKKASMFKKGFFRKLPAIKDGIRMAKMLAKDPFIDAYILTYPLGKSKYCYQEKVEWIREHLPMYVDRIILACGLDRDWETF